MDAAVVIACMMGAGSLQAELHERLRWLKAPAGFPEHAVLTYLALPVWLLLIVAFRLHSTFERVWTVRQLIGRLSRLHAAAFLVLVVGQFFTQSVINRSTVALFFVLSIAAMFTLRYILGAWSRYQHLHGANRDRVLLVGHPSQRMRDFARSVLSTELPPMVVGYLDDQERGEEVGASVMPGGLRWAGRIAALPSVLQADSVDHVLFFPPYNQPELSQGPLQECEACGIPASFAVDVIQLARVSPRVTTVADRPFITYDETRPREAALTIKYALDPLLAIVLLLLASPLLIMVALVILFSMGRPIFFVQQRAGLHGRPFSMLKFRSMVDGADAAQAALRSAHALHDPTFKLARDPRVTRLGRLLRRTSIDELPQLLNVAMGSMSLVGPRPLPLAEQARISGFRRRRLSMKPGVTCLWQVSGRSDLSFEEWMLLDLKYIDEWSMWLDLQILVRTLPAVLLARGAH